jgi:peptidoglycan/xylan/chitin deacetylase (PgdA/CDA1 family)
VGQRTPSRRRLLQLLALSGLVLVTVFVVVQLFGRDLRTEETPPTTTNPYVELVPDLPPAPPAEPVAISPDDGDVLPVVHRIPTEQPVAFITIDDGHVRSTEGLQVLEAAGVPATAFVLSPEAEADPDYFFDLLEVGVSMQAHTVTHPLLTDLPRAEHHDEVCSSGDALSRLFGERPTLFRPPYGEYDRVTQEAAAACGYDAIVHWRVTVDHGEVEYLPTAEGVEPGDILLLHFRDDLDEDLLAALRAIDDAGLTVGRLEDYL